MRIETERLVIRPFLESDAHAYAAIAADPDVMKHTGEGLPQSFDSSKDYVLRCIRSYETRGYARYAVCLKAENGLLIGFCGFMDDNGELEFGWRYGKPYWGRGWQSVAGPFRVARWGLRVSGAKRGAERWFHIVTDERQSLWPEPPCALRVTAASGHLPCCPSSIDGGTSTSSWRLAYGPMALVTRSLQGPAMMRWTPPDDLIGIDVPESSDMKAT